MVTCLERPLLTALIALLIGAAPASAGEPPLPKRKPAPPAHQAPQPQAKPVVSTSPAAPPAAPLAAPLAAPDQGLQITSAMACEARLADLGVTFEVKAPIDGDGPCDIARPLHVTALAPGIAFTPHGALNCETAEALARWTQLVLKPAAESHLNDVPTGVRHGSTYVCRVRSGSGKPSEHAIGNAVDIISLEFAERPALAIRPRDHEDGSEGDFQRSLRQGACAYFTTVLGPGTDDAHADHVHFDLRQRKRGYRICQ